MTADLTATWIGLPDDRKWRKDVAEAALRARALNAPELDAHLSKVLHLNRATAQPVEFAVHLVRSNALSVAPVEGPAPVATKSTRVVTPEF